MHHVFTNIKRVACFAIITAFIVLLNCSFNDCKNIAYAQTETDIESEYNKAIEDSLDNIDSSELDVYLNDDLFNNCFDVITFKDFVVLILNGELFSDYNSIVSVIVNSFKKYISSSLKIIIILLSIILLYKLFESFCADKYVDIKKVVRMVFTLIIVLILVSLLKDLSVEVRDVVLNIFKFCEILFPILLSLVLVSGASVSYASYTSLSVLVLETCSYVFTYLLIPLALLIMVFSLASFVFSKDTLSNIVDLLKTIFKYLVIIMVGVFGLFSSVSVISSGMKDGMSLKLTKYAIKNYVPVLGGYISDGFDIVKSSSVIIKNAFGLCGILILFFNILSPLIMYVCLIVVFKLLSIIVSFLDENSFVNIFSGVSKSVSYFVTVLCGLFLILLVFLYMIIISVSVI